MKKFLLGVILTLALMIAPQATAAPPTQAQFRSLQRQVNTLGAEVANLKASKRDLEQQIARANANSFCGFTIAYDGIYAAWFGIDIITQSLVGQRVFGPQTGINDQGACQLVGVSRTPWSEPRFSSFHPQAGPPASYLRLARLH